MMILCRLRVSCDGRPTWRFTALVSCDEATPPRDFTEDDIRSTDARAGGLAPSVFCRRIGLSGTIAFLDEAAARGG
jgi:hypothetical protein